MKDYLKAYLAKQLGHPSGWFGRGLIRLLNRENAGMNQLALEALALQDGEYILEIGFGGGYLIEQMLAIAPSSPIVGVDYSADVVTAGQKRFRKAIAQSRLTLQQASVEALPFVNQTFDAIATINTLYFWPDLGLGLAECHRILKPSGRLVLSYNAPEFLEQQQLTQHGFRAYAPDAIEDSLRQAGFIHIKTRSGSDSRNGSFLNSQGQRSGDAQIS